MSSTCVSSDTSTPVPDGDSGEMKFEVVVLPVSDVDRAKNFYQGLGWGLDADLKRSGDFRIVQLTPPGSACSIIFGTGVSSSAPGSAQRLHLTVYDVDAAGRSSWTMASR